VHAARGLARGRLWCRVAAMIAVDWEVGIARPAEEVFLFVADLHNEPHFNPDASNVVQRGDGPVGLGTVVEEDFRRVGHYVTTIAVYEQPTQLVFDARNPRTDARVRFRFAPDGASATTVSCRVELTMKGFMRLLEPLMAPVIRSRIVNTRGPMLKAALERQP
jgi:Polyketide cyclase / dehydrase and lipid transport